MADAGPGAGAGAGLDPNVFVNAAKTTGTFIDHHRITAGKRLVEPRIPTRLEAEVNQQLQARLEAAFTQCCMHLFGDSRVEVTRGLLKSKLSGSSAFDRTTWEHTESESQYVVPNLRAFMIFEPRDKAKVYENVQSWLKETIGEDIWESAGLPKDEIVRWAGMEGATIRSVLTFLYKRELTEGEVKDVGVLYFPTDTAPIHVLIYEIKVYVRARCDRYLFGHDHSNTIDVTIKTDSARLS